MFKKNLGPSGRIIRLLMGLGLIVLSLFFTSIILGLISLFILFEALMSWCVVFAILGINKCRTKK